MEGCTLPANALEKVLEEVRDFVMRHGIPRKGDLVLLAVSGGVDSMVMLDAFCRLQDELGLRLHVAHLDHMLRGDASKGDAQHVAEVARSHALSCTVQCVDIGRQLGPESGGLQQVARKERYAFFHRVARQVGARWIVTGHHRDDQAETVLWRIIRGTGLKGLGGMSLVREPFLRPLLGLWRAQLEAYAAEAGLTHREDASNLRLDYTRNRIRLQILPLLQEINPRVKEALVSLSEQAARDGDCLEAWAQRVYGELASVRWGQRRLWREGFVALPGALASRVIMRAVKDVFAPALGQLDQKGMERGLALMRKARGPTRFMWPGPLMVVVEKDWVTLVPPHDALAEQSVKVGGATALGRGMYITARLLSKTPQKLDAGSKVAYVDFDRLHAPLKVRSRRSGDRFFPLGLAGSKRVKEFFIQEKIPAHARHRVPVICAGTDIVWLASLRQDHRFRVRDTTVRVLELRLRDMPW